MLRRQGVGGVIEALFDLLQEVAQRLSHPPFQRAKAAVSHTRTDIHASNTSFSAGDTRPSPGCPGSARRSSSNRSSW